MLNRLQIFNAIQQQLVIQQQLDHADMAAGYLAVMFLRVSGLSEISLRFGYKQGERAAEKVHELLAGVLRPIDQIFRAGEDRFVIVLPAMLNHNHALLASARLVQAFEEPLRGGTMPWQVRAIMGISIHPDHGRDPDMLCRHASMALDEAQRRGESCAVYEPHDTQVEILYEELRDAIEANRLDVFFQPVLDLQSGRITGVESLARWTSMQHGGVSPASFVPFSEQSDLISALTRWSVNATLRHAAGLPADAELSLAINFSPRVFARPGTVEQLVGALDIWGVSPTAMVIEITETALVNDLESTIRVLRRLRDLGMRVAIDDFGAGYASIAYLRRFPATELKIDQSLVSEMRNDPHTSKLVNAILKMARHMELTTIAEGIENQDTQDLLTRMGCDLGQGYHLGRPEPAAEFVARFNGVPSRH